MHVLSQTVKCFRIVFLFGQQVKWNLIFPKHLIKLFFKKNISVVVTMLDRECSGVDAAAHSKSPFSYLMDCADVV